MGKGGGFLLAVKKAFSCQAIANRDKRVHRSNKRPRSHRSLDLDSPRTGNLIFFPENPIDVPENPIEVPENPIEVPESPIDDVPSDVHSHVATEQEAELIEAENEQTRQAYSVALATAVAAEAAVAAAQAAAEVVRLTSAATLKANEEMAAIKIQTAFRGYLARRAVKALRRLARLKTLVGRQSVQNQANTTLKCMQTLNRMQFEMRARRTRMTEENAAMQRQIQQKNEKELENLKESTGSDWDYRSQSKEQVDADLQHKREAATRRERALAYAYSHQQTWKNAINSSSDHAFMDSDNPHWGWSWLERWMAARPWDSSTATEKEPNSDDVSVKSLSISLQDAKTRSPMSRKQSRTPSRQSPSTPNSKSANKVRPVNSSPRCDDDDSKSVSSVLSDRCRRHSVASSSVRDDESVVSSTSVPSYMVPTVSARARSRLGLEEVGTPEKASSGSAKKRLSFSASPGGPRRHSVPSSVDFNHVKDVSAN